MAVVLIVLDCIMQLYSVVLIVIVRMLSVICCTCFLKWRVNLTETKKPKLRHYFHMLFSPRAF